LVSSRQLEAIDEFILELRFDHPIHWLLHKQYENIVYGMNDQSVKPIRVASLFHYPEHTKCMIRTTAIS
jgi:hypothetical protein